MKKVILVLFIISTVTLKSHAKVYSCESYRTSLTVDTEALTFNFMQYCWNPCHLGQGTLVPLNRDANHDGIHFRVYLDQESSNIDPIAQSEMDLYFRNDQTVFLRSLTDQNGLLFQCNLNE